jgi:hypothetical protein
MGIRDDFSLEGGRKPTSGPGLHLFHVDKLDVQSVDLCDHGVSQASYPLNAACVYAFQEVRPLVTTAGL